jgi:hypothetical protein
LKRTGGKFRIQPVQMDTFQTFHPPSYSSMEGFLYREPNACNCGARKRIELDAFSMPSPDLKQHQPNDCPEVGDTEDEQG